MKQVKELFDFINSGGRSILYTSKAASTPGEEPRHDVKITEMINGVLVTRPVKKYTDLSKPVQEEQEQESEPEITILNDSWEKEQKSKADSSVSSKGFNKVKEIHNFIIHEVNNPVQSELLLPHVRKFL
jgi:hypothetical protein